MPATKTTAVVFIGKTDNPADGALSLESPYFSGFSCLFSVVVASESKSEVDIVSEII